MYTMNKKCTKCKVIKDINEFYSCKRDKSGVRSWCKECDNNAPDNYTHSLKGKHVRMLYNDLPKTRNTRLLKKFGITLNQYNVIIKQQNNKCAICGKSTKKRLNVDHDHKTKKIRGLLCTPCNTAIGLLNDDIEIIKNVLRYLSI